MVKADLSIMEPDEIQLFNLIRPVIIEMRGKNVDYVIQVELCHDPRDDHVIPDENGNKHGIFRVISPYTNTPEIMDSYREVYRYIDREYKNFLKGYRGENTRYNQTS
jgi:hypothetical protein